MHVPKEIIPGFTYSQLCKLKAEINKTVQIYKTIGYSGAAKIINYDQTLEEFVAENKKARMRLRGWIIDFKWNFRNKKPTIVSVEISNSLIY